VSRPLRVTKRRLMINEALAPVYFFFIFIYFFYYSRTVFGVANRPSERASARAHARTYTPFSFASLSLLLFLPSFSRFSIVSRINAPHDRPRYAEKNPSASRSTRRNDDSLRTYRYLFIRVARCSDRRRPARRAPRATAAICARYSLDPPDAGNQTIPEPRVYTSAEN